MEPANEETGPVPRPQPLPSPPPQSSTSIVLDVDSIVTASISDGVSASNGPTILPAPNNAPSRKDRPASGVIPPYWSHHRNPSRASQASVDQPAITLEDNTEDPYSETSRGLWAKSVTVDDYVVVEGKTGIGAYVVWNCRIQTLDVRLSP